jgi:hypothetical protein
MIAKTSELTNSTHSNFWNNFSLIKQKIVGPTTPMRNSIYGKLRTVAYEAELEGSQSTFDSDKTKELL